MALRLPTTHELKDAIVDILSSARDEGRLGQLTVRIVRQELATRFTVEEDVLGGGEYRSFIKETVHVTIDSLAPNEDGKSPQQKTGKKGRVNDGTKEGSRKRSSNARVRPSGEEPSDEEDASEGDAPSSKKVSSRFKHSKPSKTLKKPESDKKYKSKATVESSDEEAALKSSPQKPARSPRLNKVSATSSSPKQKQKQKVDKVDLDVDMDTGESPGLSNSSPKPKSTTESPKSGVPKARQLPRDPMESELSSVTDEPPKKRQKKQEKESVKPPKEEKIKRGKKEALSKDEEMVNKLKGIVVACGVRKVWKKEFEGLDKPSQQIKRLHSILADLGMTPRYSMEKAKAIRERRELAQELKDVQDFAKAIQRRGKGSHSPSETEHSADDGNSDADIPARKKQNARASIMAFLQDQSEEE